MDVGMCVGIGLGMGGIHVFYKLFEPLLGDCYTGPSRMQIYQAGHAAPEYGLGSEDYQKNNVM